MRTSASSKVRGLESSLPQGATGLEGLMVLFCFTEEQYTAGLTHQFNEGNESESYGVPTSGMRGIEYSTLPERTEREPSTSHHQADSPAPRTTRARSKVWTWLRRLSNPTTVYTVTCAGCTPHPT